MSAVDFEAMVRRSLTDEAEPSRTRVKHAVLVLCADGRRATIDDIMGATGLPRRTVNRHLAQLREVGLLVSLNGIYAPANDDRAVPESGTQNAGKRHSECRKAALRMPESGTAVLESGTARSEVTPSAAGVAISKDLDPPPYSPPPHTAGRGSDRAGLLAGSDRASPTHIPTLAEGIPMEGSEGGRATGPSAPDEGPLPGWPDFSATTGEPEFPLEWLDGVFNLLREMTPPPRGQRYARPLNQRDQRIVEEHIRGLGGWKRFDELVLPALREAQGVKSPLGWLGWKCKQISKGEAPAEGLRWVPPEYRNEGGGSRTIIAALTSVAWGGRPDPDVQRGAMAWALAHIDDSRVREALCNKIGPSPWATAEVREALARYP